MKYVRLGYSLETTREEPSCPTTPHTWRDYTSGLTAEQVTQLERIKSGGQPADLLAVLAQQLAAVNDTQRLVDDTEALGW